MLYRSVHYPDFRRPRAPRFFGRSLVSHWILHFLIAIIQVKAKHARGQGGPAVAVRGLSLRRPTGRRAGTFEVRMKTQGEIEAAICEGISRFEQEFMGRGPKDIRAHLIGDLIVIRLQGVLTAAEQHLVASSPPRRAAICSSRCGSS